MTIYDQLAKKIIMEQALLMGPVAWKQASEVDGLHIDEKSKEILVDENDGIVIIDRLVNRYGNLFGRAGREFCKEAVSSLIADLSPTQVPASLK